ncbi:MAG: sulfate adenylyltransferase subunit 1 [Salibacteraceae bacterium]
MNENQLLRFTTAGSVDDGKSTLIGRLLYDSKSILQDQLSAVKQASKTKGIHAVDLALFTDGLKEERELGITIDVAYRYFSTPKRKFIIADAPGHFQYTRNLVTAASTANAVVLIIDATKGVVEQTKRHLFIASLLQIQELIVCVNKMDLVDYSEKIFEDIKTHFEQFSSKLAINNIQFIPMSALLGDNVVSSSSNMTWHKGPSLLDSLETLSINDNVDNKKGRFAVQTVLNPPFEKEKPYKGYAGRISSGIFKKGEKITVLPSGLTSTIRSINSYENELNEAFAPMSASMVLNDDLQINRGDMIVSSNEPPTLSQEFEAMLCWLNEKKAISGARYLVRHTVNEQFGTIEKVISKYDIETFELSNDDKAIEMNDIVRVQLKLNKPLIIDSFRDNQSTGSFILIDSITNETVAAGMIVK